MRGLSGAGASGGEEKGDTSMEALLSPFRCVSVSVAAALADNDVLFDEDISQCDDPLG